MLILSKTAIKMIYNYSDVDSFQYRESLDPQVLDLFPFGQWLFKGELRPLKTQINPDNLFLVFQWKAVPVRAENEALCGEPWFPARPVPSWKRMVRSEKSLRLYFVTNAWILPTGEFNSCSSEAFSRFSSVLLLNECTDSVYITIWRRPFKVYSSQAPDLHWFISLQQLPH